MTHFRCPEKGCDWEIDGYNLIHEILAHEKTHKKIKKEIVETREVPCEHCNGKGYTEEKYTKEVDVSETDSGRDE